MKKKVTSIATAAILSSAVMAANVSASTYIVQKGDNLTLIAKKHKTTAAELKKLNNMTSDIIYANQSLKVSASLTSFPAPKVVKPAQTSNIKPITYKVIKGDNLSKIAASYKISLNDLISWNKLKSRTIYPGQMLKVTNPSNVQAAPPPPIVVPNAKKKSSAPTANTEYTVKSGDTLSKIALQTGVSVDSLKQWNNLKSDLIYVNQKLVVQKKQDDQPASSKAIESPSIPSPAEQTAESIAKELLGIPYKWAGNTPDGFDCSGFIYHVYNQSGKTINRYSSAGYFNRSYYIDDPQPGDLVFFANTYIQGISHMGIYIGNNEFIHASEGGVVISSLNSPYYQEHFDSFKRFY